MVSARNLSSAFGFTSMFGGAMLLLLIVMLALLPSSGSISLATGGSMILLGVAFLIPGAVGLYVAQRPVLGRVGFAAWALLLVGLVLLLLNSVLAVAGGVSANPLLGLLGSVVLLAGTTSFGVVVVRADVLAHARVGGILLAVSLPFAFALGMATNVLNLSLPVLLPFLATLPFSLAWFLLGLDLLTVDSGGVDVTVIREPD